MVDGLTRFLNQPRWRLALAGAITAAALIYLSYWAGIPERGPVAFLLGIAALVAVTLASGAAAWRLAGRVASANEISSSSSIAGVATRRWFATLLAIATLSLTFGGFWDEVWHRKYGLPFGEDLLWRPHLLIYMGLLLPSALAAVSVILLLLRGRGKLVDRVRGDRNLTLLVILGGFLLFAVPADPVWHRLYGEDISAWSLPHLVLMLSALMVAVLGVRLHLSTTPARRDWAHPTAAPPSLLVVALFSGAASLMAQVLIGDFAAAGATVIERPVWLLPALMTGLALMLGTAANHASRTYGAASAVGVLTIAMRYGLVLAFDFPEIQPSAWLPWLPPLVALDAWYAFRVAGRRPPASAMASAGAVLVGLAAGLALIPNFYSYIRFTPIDFVVSLAMGGIVAAAAIWLGKMLGDFVGSNGEGVPAERAPVPRRASPAPALLLGWLAFVVYFVATSTPPT
ncbi:MAG TPA: hypothetical protein VFI11_09840 [Anaerolineales bacterium]|nr:hypothetical protein [Anaerolineales bacterium]